MNLHNSAAVRGTPAVLPHAAIDALQARFALRVAAGLTERSLDLGADLNERLRFARANALERARATRTAEVAPIVGATRGGAALLGSAGAGWGIRFASIAPVLVLVAGLVLIQRWQDNVQISAAAEVDAALLSDALPPGAYSDAGFTEFLKTPTPSE